MHRTRRKLYPTPDEAENAFYEAFERGDLAAMMAVWAESDEVVCVHPRGPRLVGFQRVSEGWAQIFAGGAGLRVKTSSTRRFDSPTVAIRSVVESVSARGQDAPASSVCATNVYELTESGWRMVVHHASPLAEVPAAEEAVPAGTPHTLH